MQNLEGLDEILSEERNPPMETARNDLVGGFNPFEKY